MLKPSSRFGGIQALRGAGASLALVCGAAFAQTPSTGGAASAPAAVGVTPATAAAAKEKAVPRSDTGTVVRTGPSAADRARQMRSNTGSNTGTAGTADAAASQPAGTGTVTGTSGMRPARADRN